MSLKGSDLEATTQLSDFFFTLAWGRDLFHDRNLCMVSSEEAQRAVSGNYLTQGFVSCFSSIFPYNFLQKQLP